MSRKLFVGNLPYSVTSERLSEAFSQFGNVTSSKVIVDRETGRSRGFAFLEMDLKVHNPVFAGDTLHVECEVIEARLSKSRPGRGLVRTRNRIVKHDGTLAITYTPMRMIKCRDKAAG